MNKRGDAYSSGMRGGEKPRKGELQSVTIQVAKNGYLLRCDYEAGGQAAFLAREKPRVFEQLDDALAAAKKDLAK